MHQATVEITLLQPAVFSLQSASAGAHRGLDFIPGSTLLGHAAAALYAELAADDAWLLFHSGHMRFGDGLPAHASFVARPMPLCWHSEKGESIFQGQQILGDKLVDPSFGPLLRTPAQVRAGYTTQAGDFVLPPRSQTLKTAIDPATGQAADGQLFGYEAIAAGQVFIARLQADEDIRAALWSRIIRVMEGRARLGRSRSAQFGQVEMRVVPTDVSEPDIAPASTELTLWLLSDVALENAGQPCLRPEAHLIGLPQGSRWLPHKSFLRSRRYSPYNAYRRHYDPERQVICRGSVLRYELPEPLDRHTAATLESGIGLHVEAGLGHVLVNPTLLETASPQFDREPRRHASPSFPPTKQAQMQSRFLPALESRHARLRGNSTDETAIELHRSYSLIIERMRSFDGYAEPPGRSQWGRIKQLASDHRNNPKALKDALFDPENGAIRARAGTGWEIRYGTNPKDTLASWMEDRLREKDGDLAQLLGHWANLVLHASPGATLPQAETHPGVAS